jgi:hypothetical protein
MLLKLGLRMPSSAYTIYCIFSWHWANRALSALGGIHEDMD